MFSDGLGADSKQRLQRIFCDRPHQLLVVGVGTESDEEGLAPLERKSLQATGCETPAVIIMALTVDDGDVRQHQPAHQQPLREWWKTAPCPGWTVAIPWSFVCLALFLMWFRKGWTLTWAWLLLPLVLGSTPARPRPGRGATCKQSHSRAALVRRPVADRMTSRGAC